MADIWTQADIDTLKAAIASGTKIVNYEGPPKRMVEYQDVGPMRAALAGMIKQVTGSPSFRRASFSKGFDPPREPTDE